MHTSQKMPSSIIVPNAVNEKLTFDSSQQTMPQTKFKEKYKEHLASINRPSVPMVQPTIPITSTQPPLIWFPGNSDCKNQDSGTYKRLNDFNYNPLIHN